MKLIHLSDLHIGKRVNEFSMLEDQKYILESILDIVENEDPEAIVIAGDIYDRPVPPVEAVQLFDSFLVRLFEQERKIIIISGNHDSPERIAFGGRMMSAGGVYVSPAYQKDMPCVTLADQYGAFHIYMLPFVKPVHVRAQYPDEEILSWTDAVATVIEHMEIDRTQRNILVTHQFAAGAVRCESEDLSVGGTEGIDASVFEVFDYTALGHIHRPQTVGTETIRYCGSPLKYSFSECGHSKSVTVAEFFQKGDVRIHTVPLIPRHEMREIKGMYMEVTAKAFYEHMDTEDYMHITLTDEEDIPEAIGKLRAVYPNLMRLDYDNARTRNAVVIERVEEMEKKSPLALFAELYELQNYKEITGEQQEFLEKLIDQIWEGQQ